MSMPEGGPNQDQLFPVYQTEKLKVSPSKRRLDRMARDASLNPDAYEANALTKKTRKAQIRGVAAAGLARLRKHSEEHPELKKGY